MNGIKELIEKIEQEGLESSLYNFDFSTINDEKLIQLCNEAAEKLDNIKIYLNQLEG
jgi:hypothetical protein